MHWKVEIKVPQHFYKNKSQSLIKNGSGELEKEYTYDMNIHTTSESSALRGIIIFRKNEERIGLMNFSNLEQNQEIKFTKNDLKKYTDPLNKFNYFDPNHLPDSLNIKLKDAEE